MHKKNIISIALIVTVSFLFGFYMNDNGSHENSLKFISAKSQSLTPPNLVNSDGSYPMRPLEKERVVLKVIQGGVNKLSNFPSVEAGLESNLQLMERLADKACATGKNPTFSYFMNFR